MKFDNEVKGSAATLSPIREDYLYNYIYLS